MDDTFKGVLFGFLGLLVFHGSLEKRVSHDATRQVEESFNWTGSVHTSVEARGLFGVYANRLYSIDVRGDGLKSDCLPFVVNPREGWKGSIRHLRLHLDNLTLRGLPVERFDADIPNVTYDLGYALYRDRLVIRGAGEGPAYVRIGAPGLRIFIARKYSRRLTVSDVSFRGGRVVISGMLLLFGSATPFVASGELAQREGRYIDLVQPDIRLNGSPVAETTSAGILKQVNPVLDVAADLGLSGYFTLTRVEIGSTAITVHGRAGIPLADTGNHQP